MTPKERQDAKRVAQVIRAARKHAGCSQVDLARSLSVTQATLSNFESGKGLPSVSQWYDICVQLGIPNATKTFRLGLIDRCSPTVSNTASEPGGFRVPKKYSRHAASKVRLTRLFIRYFSAAYGHERVEQYIKHAGVDPDFFAVLDNQISMKFTLDLVETLIRGGTLKSDDLPKMATLVVTPEIQGNLVRIFYKSLADQRALLKEFVSHSQMYEANCEFRLEDETSKSLVVSVKPKAVMRNFDHGTDTLGTFLSDFRKEWIRHFTTLGGKPPLRIETLENHYRGAPKCVYKIFC